MLKIFAGPFHKFVRDLCLERNHAKNQTFRDSDFFMFSRSISQILGPRKENLSVLLHTEELTNGRLKIFGCRKL